MGRHLFRPHLTVRGQASILSAHERDYVLPFVEHPMSVFQRIKLPILILLISEALLILLFPGSLLFQSTLSAGGDTPSHFMAAIAMSRGLRAFFSPVTWIHGAFGGFPLFLQYFPLPFAMTAIVSLVLPLKIAFKLLAPAAIIPLPAAAYLCLRRLGYQQNTAAIGAALSLPFLFMTENSMWGGNIYSTLAGEFAFGISLILYVIFIGKIYADIARGKSPWGSSILESLIGIEPRLSRSSVRHGNILFSAARRQPALHNQASRRGFRTRRVLAVAASLAHTLEFAVFILLAFHKLDTNSAAPIMAFFCRCPYDRLFGHTRPVSAQNRIYRYFQRINRRSGTLSFLAIGDRPAGLLPGALHAGLPIPASCLSFI